jgi:cell division protease FtsH
MEDVEESATKVKMGPARKRLQSIEDRKITAYHESGHAIVTHALPKMDPVHRISIVARGMSLGHTLIPPAADITHDTKKRFLAQLAAMMGGRAAEELVFDDITAGASNDIENATRLARVMVTDFGMSDLGPINMGQQTGYDDFGNINWTEATPVSPALQEKIDLEVKKIMDTAHKLALSILKTPKERKNLEKVAESLLKKETLDRDDFEKIVGKNK